MTARHNSTTPTHRLPTGYFGDLSQSAWMSNMMAATCKRLELRYTHADQMWLVETVVDTHEWYGG